MSLPPYLAQRKQDRIAHYKTELDQSIDVIMISPDDTGVIRNGGRLGTRHGPTSLLHFYSQMTATPSQKPWSHTEVCRQPRKGIDPFSFDFITHQQQETALIKNVLKNKHRRLIQLGGGHDHIYPLLTALDEQLAPTTSLLIINFDAHLDTRVDSQFHSGTPFRQFSQTATRPFQLWQVGIHDYANPQANFEALTPQGQMQVLSLEQCLAKLAPALGEQVHVVLSLDADGLDCSVMEAVSAVNPSGLMPQAIEQTLEILRGSKSEFTFGIYEYNPLYDNLSAKGARVLASLMESALRA